MTDEQDTYQPTPEMLALESLIRTTRAISGLLSVAAHASMGAAATRRGEGAIKEAFDGLFLANMRDRNLTGTPEGKYLADALARIQRETADLS